MNPILFAEFRKAGFSVDELIKYWEEYKNTFNILDTDNGEVDIKPQPSSESARINRPRKPDEELQNWRDMIEKYVLDRGVAGAEFKDIYRAHKSALEAAGHSCGIRGSGYNFLSNRAADLLRSGKLVRQAGELGCNSRWFHKEVVESNNAESAK